MPQITRLHRIGAVLAISVSFFLVEIAVGFRTHSLALVADALHYLNDVLANGVAFTAVLVSYKEQSPQGFSYGWQRAELLGSFFNGVFLLALAVSIGLQSIEKFTNVQPVEDPRSVLIVGCIGLGLNIASAIFLHEHSHHPKADIQLGFASSGNGDLRSGSSDPHAQHHHVQQSAPLVHERERDLGMLGVFIHVVGDAVNNIMVIIAAVIMWFTKSYSRFYADPSVSLIISIIICTSAIPLTLRSGRIFLQAAPANLSLDCIRQDLASVDGIEDVHDLHVWRLTQNKLVASVHVTMASQSMEDINAKDTLLRECFHAYGIHSATIQPEIISRIESTLSTALENPRHQCWSRCVVQSCTSAPCCE